MYEWAYRFSFISIQYEIVTSILFLLLEILLLSHRFSFLKLEKKLICGIQNRFNLLIRKDCFEIHTIIFY